VYRRRKLVVKWNLDAGKVMKGTMTPKILEVIRQLEAEGWL